ncbi:glycosyltransferase family 2 protein [Nocardioides caldifontis]|uniref:glycosyltransferase family 2 protein n=1 Tax=Nocardioides caldifontis TaxID=2588938 RepID=UPI0011DFE316|nr:glycosyltransferase family 2 protein [Nocardioides caldifontis]
MTAGQPLDILMPFYGEIGLMQEAVRSILAQDHEGWRLTVVDDGTPGPVAEWFGSLDDERVTYLRNETNLGANANYRKALGLAQGSHVVMMGADDVMLPGYVRSVLAVLEQYPEASVVQPGVEVVDEDGRVSRPLGDLVKRRLQPKGAAPVAMAGEALAASLLLGNWTYFPSLCWRTDVIRRIGFRPDFHVVQDLALLMDIVLDGGVLVFAPEVAFQYRRHRSSDSSLKSVTGYRFAEEAALFGVMADACRDRGWPRAARAARLHLTSRLHAVGMVPRALQAGQHAPARALLRHAFAIPA